MVDYWDQSHKNLPRGWQPTALICGASRRRKSLLLEQFHCPQLRWKEGPLYGLWSQALGHGGTDYPKQMKPSLRWRDSWGWEQNGALSWWDSSVDGGRAGPSDLTSLAVLCPKSGHPFSTWPFLKVILCYGCSVTQSYLIFCNPVDSNLPDSSVHGDSPGKTTGVGCHFLLQEIFPTQGLDSGLPHCRQILNSLSHRGSHKIC